MPNPAAVRLRVDRMLINPFHSMCAATVAFIARD